MHLKQHLSASNGTLIFVEPDDEADIAAFAIDAGYPLCFVHQRLDEKHAHAAGIFFAMHLAIDVRLGRVAFSFLCRRR